METVVKIWEALITVPKATNLQELNMLRAVAVRSPFMSISQQIIKSLISPSSECPLNPFSSPTKLVDVWLMPGCSSYITF